MVWALWKTPTPKIVTRNKTREILGTLNLAYYMIILYRWSIDDLSMIYRYIDDISMIYRWSIDGLSMIDRWSIDVLPMIEPCFRTNGHPMARMDTILRQCEAEVKIFNSRWFPASIYRSKWSIIAGQGSNMKKSSKKSIFWKCLFGFFYRSRGSRGPSGRVQNRSRSLKMTKYSFFSNFHFF